MGDDEKDRPLSSSSTVSNDFGAAPALENGPDDDRSPDEAAAHTGLGPEYSTLHECAFVFILCLGQFLALSGLSQTIAPLGVISKYFDTKDPGIQSWLTAGYSLGVGTFIMPAGRLGDMYGHRRLFIIGCLWFALWSLIAGFSAYSNLILLCACRGFQGIGPAIMVPNTLAILGRTYKMGTKKTMAFGMYAAAAPIGFFFGALFSCIYAEFAWWPWSFWTMAMACCLLAVLAFAVLPADAVSDGDDPIQFDTPGCITGVLGLILINFAWNQAGVVGWQTPYVYVLLIIGFIQIGLFAYIELHVAEQPLIPLRSLTKEAYLALACVSAGWGSFGLWVYYLWLLLERVRHHTPLSATAQTAPTVLSGLAASIATGYLLNKVPVSNLLFTSFLCFITGMTLLATVPADQTYWAQTFVSIVIMPWGMDISFPSGTVIVSNAMAKEHQGMAASLVNTVVNYSISMGLGFGGTILKNLDPMDAHPFRDFKTMWYFGIGLDGLGLCIAACFVWCHYWAPSSLSASQ